jgi:glycyl-tRNA synthetase beta chain
MISDVIEAPAQTPTQAKPNASAPRRRGPGVGRLKRLLNTENGRRLLASYKRVTGVLRVEEKKDGREYRGKPNPRLYLQKEERELAVAIAAVKGEAAAAIAREDLDQALHAVARLRTFLDAFFDKVILDVPAADRRENRLKLLNEIREATRTVADASPV